MDTTQLYAKSDEAQIKLDRIARANNEAYAEMDASARKLAAAVPGADINALLNHVHDGLQDALCDVIDRIKEERLAADEQIGEIEFEDLLLSRVS